MSQANSVQVLCLLADNVRDQNDSTAAGHPPEYPKFGTKAVARYEKTEFYKPEDRNITFLGFAELAKFTIIANFSYLF